MPLVSRFNPASTKRKDALRLKRIVIGDPLYLVFCMTALTDHSRKPICRRHLLDPTVRRIVPYAHLRELRPPASRDDSGNADMGDLSRFQQVCCGLIVKE